MRHRGSELRPRPQPKSETAKAADRDRRAEARRRRQSQQRLQMGFYVFCFFALFGAYWYANDLGNGSPVLRGAELRAPDGSAFLAQDVDAKIQELGASDLRKQEQQRELVAELARRHVGTLPGGGSLDALDVLQRLIDERVLKTDQVYELQALGVVLGDVMAAQLGLEWVVVSDEYGRSRALRWGEKDDVFFPITMISKRYQKDIIVDVRTLYENAKREVEALGRRRPSV